MVLILVIRMTSNLKVCLSIGLSCLCQYILLRVCNLDTDPIPTFELDTIKIVWHPSEEREPEIMSPEEWDRLITLKTTDPRKMPWRPYFRTREDFEFANILRKYGMKAEDQDALIKLKGGGGQSKVTFNGYAEVANAWELAKLDLVRVCI